jgi:hypothetical protein
MSRLIKEKRGQFVIIAALLIAALTLATTISIHEINIHGQSITYRPVDEFLLGTTSDMNRALTVALANYTDGVANNKTSIVEANYTAYRTASQFMTTWKESLLTSYSSYGIRINPDYDMTPRFEIGPWNGTTPWANSSTFSFAYIPYGFDVDSYGFKGWVGATEKYVQLQIFSETVETNWTTGSTSLRFQLTQSVVNGNYSTPITDLPSNPDDRTFRIGTYNATNQSFNPVSEPPTLTYLGGGNYSVTFNQTIDSHYKGLRLDLATPKDEIWISALNYNDIPGELGTYYVSYNSSSGQNSFLTNSPSLPPFSKVNPELNNGHPTMNITSNSPVPSIVTSNPIYITLAVQAKSGGKQNFQTIQIQLGFNYNGTYYPIGNDSFNALAAPGNPPPAFYTVSISVLGTTFVPGFPVQTIPAGSQIVLTITVITQTNRIDIYGGMGGTRIVFF